ncbi:MFS transporter [Donghicola tyrosinivorans]|uniref:Putative MFS family arabinose efflux permease n=1 Tax=Donghicola tyrosinivorans TaxID=1652492 RepID=A0A2T0WPY2_9RHOB|nr:MFS transporter [Donghicola tyrosinivorans]PRY88756.1 putative MFS family arabinose efflux permease [Donghicola tyrosinivorans]
MGTDLRDTRLARASCALAIFSALLGSTAPSPLYPLYLEELHLSKGMGTAIFSTYAAGTMLALLIFGKIGGRVSDLRRIIVPGLLMTALGAVIFAVAHSLPVLLVGRFLNGFGTGAITGMASAALFAIYPPDMRRVAAVTATVAFTGGAAGGPLLSSLAIWLDLAPTVTPFVVIVILAVLAAIGLIVSHWPRKDISAPLPASPQGPEKVDMPLFLLACLVVCVAWMLGSVLMALGTDLGLTVYHLHSPALAGLVPAIFQLFGGLGQYLSGRYPAQRAILAGLVGMAVAQIVLIAAIPGAIGAVLIALMPVCGFFYGAAFVGSLGAANRASTPATREAYISRFYMAGYLANSVPTVIVGYLSDIFSLKTAFLGYSIVIIGLAIGGILFLRRLEANPWRQGQR